MYGQKKEAFKKNRQGELGAFANRGYEVTDFTESELDGQKIRYGRGKDTKDIS